MNILETIIAQKRIEVEACKRETNVLELEKKPLFQKASHSLKSYIRDEKRTGIIAEYKRQSPSKGIINGTATVEEVTSAYAKYGASGISVLTDDAFFGGTLADLEAATFNDVPLLRKDFTIDAYQLVEAKAYGASVILLIAACLTPQEVKNLTRSAKDLGLEVLLELHDDSELDHICAEVDLVGINNRNLKTFAVDLEQSVKLAQQIGDGFIKVAESGISSVDNIHFLKQKGFEGFLIGENFMKAADPGAAFKAFAESLTSCKMKIKVCGITSIEQMQALAHLGVDYAGLIFYSKSARYAGEKLAGLKEEIKAIGIKKVGVFVNESSEEVERKIKDFDLAAVQLHGDEDVAYCKALMPHAEVIKVFRIKDEPDLQMLIEPFKEACHYFLFDTDTKGYGGSGKSFDWNKLENVTIGKPFFLSGGIGLEDVEKIKMFQNPFVYAVDVNSRFETAPGVKDMRAVENFISDLNQETWKK